MAQLAIKGHPTRGEEVIEILEMLGGIGGNYKADFTSLLFFIGRANYITYDDIENSSNYVVFNLENFLEKFPYKVGDKVKHKGATYCGTVYEIEQIKWEDNQVKYIICNLYWKNCKCTVTAEDLQPYKEETMEETIKIDIPKGYEFTGVDDDNQQVVFEKIGCQYPKTYEECCEILELESKFTIDDLTVDEKDFLKSIIKLKECRDAYWIIAGFWNPDFTNKEQKKFTISFIEDEIYFSGTYVRNSFLVFPTAETRDAFYENFKDLIEQCKKLL